MYFKWALLKYSHSESFPVTVSTIAALVFFTPEQMILIVTLLLLKVIKVNVLPSNSLHRYEVHKGEHGILYFAQTIADVAINSHNITHTFPI